MPERFCSVCVNGGFDGRSVLCKEMLFSMGIAPVSAGPEIVWRGFCNLLKYML
jgi:hypothetical protein